MRYPDDTTRRRAFVLQLLDDNDGDVYRTSLETGVPPRTLHEWQDERETAETAADQNSAAERRS